MFTSINIDDTVMVSSEALPKEVFLYIGNTAFFYEQFAPFYPNTQHVSDYSAARNILSNADDLPELIIIDVPLNTTALVSFKAWLKKSHLQNIPLFYNQTALTSQQKQIKQLFSQKLVDDVIKLEEHYASLSYKIKFIQKINNHQGGSSKKIKTPLSPITERDLFFAGKRILDIIISVSLIICCLPLFIMIAIAVKCGSKGPIFYFSSRAGKGFRIFNFYKFRTMALDADKKMTEFESLNQYDNNNQQPSFFKLKNDPRVNKVGAFLRKTSLDELPQLFNVLKGDMSMVGNRPLPLYEASTLTTDKWAERFMAPAGITGLWQVSKRGKPEMSNIERIHLDIDYARSTSLMQDVRILLQTPAAMIQKTNV